MKLQYNIFFLVEFLPKTISGFFKFVTRDGESFQVLEVTHTPTSPSPILYSEGGLHYQSTTYQGEFPDYEKLNLKYRE